MQVRVIATCGEAKESDLAGRTALIIDVLRATTNMVTALANGGTSVVAVESVEQARAAARPGDLLGGERHCVRIDGFDLGNSPFEYNRDKVQGKRIVCTTTNGTRAVEKAAGAAAVLACSLLNAEACARAAFGLGNDIAIICSGTQDVFSLEDGLCAGLVVDHLMQLAGCEETVIDVCDLGLAMRLAYRAAAPDLEGALRNSSNGHRLTRLGFADDLAYCARTDCLPIVPMVRGGELTL